MDSHVKMIHLGTIKKKNMIKTAAQEGLFVLVLAHTCLNYIKAYSCNIAVNLQ